MGLRCSNRLHRLFCDSVAYSYHPSSHAQTKYTRNSTVYTPGSTLLDPLSMDIATHLRTHTRRCVCKFIEQVMLIGGCLTLMLAFSDAQLRLCSIT
jgi:hypothetical protein